MGKVEGEMEDKESGGTKEEEENEPLNITLNSVVGITNPKTVKLVGKIAELEVVLMIDLGATTISCPWKW